MSEKIDNWFNTARFGMFVHWGHSSQLGVELSWPLAGGVFSLPFCNNIEVDEYHKSAKTFNPQKYNPQELASLAKRLGMQYAIFTAKHHDGFAMFNTQSSDFSIHNLPYQKDIVKEFIEAMRSGGIRIGLYFSLIDWHHPDYPAFTETDKPYNLLKHRQPTTEQWQDYTDFMFAQVRELLTNYGKIDIIWFDGSWERTPQQWKAAELNDMIRALQPDILINDRLPGFGDFATPEQFIPPQPLDTMWESCMTINESWGYNSVDTNFKSSRQIIHTLCEVAGKGGNLLLNVAPMGDGQIQPELLERLAVVETWMQAHQESIVGTQPGLEPWQFYGSSTRKKNLIYLHLLWKPYETISVRGVPIKKIKSVYNLKDKTPLHYTTRCAIMESFNPNPTGELTITVPKSVIDPYATVIVINITDD